MHHCACVRHQNSAKSCTHLPINGTEPLRKVDFFLVKLGGKKAQCPYKHQWVTRAGGSAGVWGEGRLTGSSGRTHHTHTSVSKWLVAARGGRRTMACRSHTDTHSLRFYATDFLPLGKILKRARWEEAATSKTQAVRRCDVNRCKCAGRSAGMRRLCQPIRRHGPTATSEARWSALKSFFYWLGVSLQYDTQPKKATKY